MTQADRWLGLWSAGSAAGLGLIYLAVGFVGVVMRPPGLPMLAQVDPYLAILEGLIMLSAIALLAMAAAVRAFAGPERKTSATIALALMAAFALLTCATHFVSLTLGRQLAGPQNAELVRHLSFEWPSVTLALDLLAWDILLGLALLFMAPVFGAERPGRAIRATALVAGLLCMAGSLGPITAMMPLQLLAVFGYAFLVPVLCLMIAVLFARLAECGAEG